MSERERLARRMLFSLLLLPALSVLGFALGLVLGVRGPDVPMLGLALATFCLAFVPLAIDQGRPPERRHLLISMIGVTYSAFFAVPVLTYYLPATGPVDPAGMVLSNLLPRHIARGQSLALLGLACLMLGYALPLGRLASRLCPTQKWEWKGQSTLLAAVILIPLGWMVSLAFRFGILPENVGSGFIGGFADATLFGPAILTVAYWRHRSRLALYLLFLLVPLSSGYNFFTGRKRFVLTPPAMVILAWMVMQRRIRVRWLALGVLSLVLLYPAAEFYRFVILGDLDSAGAVMRNPLPALNRTLAFVSSTEPLSYLGDGLHATGRRLDGIGHLSVIVRDTPAVSPFQNGRTLLLIPITYVPRLLWPGKPDINISGWIVDTYRYRGEFIESNIGPTWVGEFFLNFAIPGVIVGMALLGMLLRFTHECLVRAPTTFAILIEVVILYEVMLQPSGGVSTVINAPIMAMIPIVGMHVLIRVLGGARRWRHGVAPESQARPAAAPASAALGPELR